MPRIPSGPGNSRKGELGNNYNSCISTNPDPLFTEWIHFTSWLRQGQEGEKKGDKKERGLE